MLNISAKMDTRFDRDGNPFKGYASVVIGESLKLTHIAVREGKEGLYVKMPERKTTKTDEEGKAIYESIFQPSNPDMAKLIKDVILSAFDNKETSIAEIKGEGKVSISKVTATPYEKDKLLGLANVTFEDSILIKGIRIYGKDNGSTFVALPSFKNGENYQDYAYPITSELRSSINEKIKETLAEVKELSSHELEHIDDEQLPEGFAESTLENDQEIFRAKAR